MMDKAEVKSFIADIEKMVASRAGADMASLVALNSLLCHPKAEEIFDDELKSAVKDLWISLKSYGIDLDDPPLLFGLPEGFGEDESEEIENELEAAAAHLAEEAKEIEPVAPVATEEAEGEPAEVEPAEETPPQA